MRFKVFISSVQCEFAAERQMLAEYVRKDPLFRDRLEIMNPGALPPGWTASTLLTTHESIPRNKVIVKALDWAGYVERSGHGTEFIIEKCEAKGLPTPQYKSDTALFHSIIWRKHAKSDEVSSVAHQVAPAVAPVVAPDNTAGRIYVLLRNGPLTRLDIATTLGVTKKARSLKLAFDFLLEDGLIEYTMPERPKSPNQAYRLTSKGRQMLTQKGR